MYSDPGRRRCQIEYRIWKGSKVIMEEKKNLLTYAGLKKLEEELHDLKVVKRKQRQKLIKKQR